MDPVALFQNCLQVDPNVSVALAAIQTLMELIKVSKAVTLAELRHNLKTAIEELTVNAEQSVTSISSGCELFLRFITLTALDHTDFEECKNVLVERGALFLRKAESSRKKIASISQQYIRDGSTVLTHSSSRCVLNVLKEARDKNKHLTIYITESMPDKQGWKMKKNLEDLGIQSTVILDSAVGYIMERVDLILVGAEAVVESGGIINKIGTCQLTVMAKAMNKPVYVAAESFKFLREYPLNQKEVPNKFKYMETISKGHPLVDYTPPAYLALMFTDLGILTPSAVSDELIKLYL